MKTIKECSFLIPKLILSAGVVALLMQDASAQSAGSYYDRSEEGWWWYQDPPVVEPEPEAPPEEKEEEPSPIVVMEAPPAEEMPDQAPKGPPALSSAWFRENLQTYMDKAIDDPTEENVEVYFLLQRIMMDKAQEFTDMSQRVVMGDKLLDEVNRRPLSPSSSRRLEQISADKREVAFEEVLQKAGLAYFFSSECALCPDQAQTLNKLSERSGLEVLPVSLDGEPLPNGLFADNTVLDQGQAEQLGIDEGPALVLMVPPDRWVPISFGALTQSDLISRTLMASVEEGLISEEAYNETLPVNKTASLASLSSDDEELPDDPKALIQYLRSLETPQ